MAETESITVAEVSDGPCGSGEPGASVDLPVVELLTGRGFVTGKSGAGKSNSASVITEKLLDNGFGMLIVDIDGEYYGLKEEYEILHAGDDEECDIRVTVDHAEKIASLALEQNVPIILDVSSFLDEDEARELLTEVARHLFAKAKKQKQPFLLLVEEVHEYIPQKGSVGECGQMLIKISKRGRKHGLGVMGVSQRPADVKKDFITQCDWLVWHRLTWNNDTKVVSRVLDSDYANAVEDLDDGEAFLVTDWAESIERVQFHRKKTFDAGATPGLDDFERPDLKSVSEDLVSELQEISDEQAERESRIEELREELDRKNSRIAELETELEDARDMQRMADQFTQALIDQVNGANPGRTEQERMRDRRNAVTGDWGEADDGRRDDDYDLGAMTWPGEGDADRDGSGWPAGPEPGNPEPGDSGAGNPGPGDSGGGDPETAAVPGEVADSSTDADDETVSAAVADAEGEAGVGDDPDGFIGVADAFAGPDDDAAVAADAASGGVADGGLTRAVTRGFDGVEGNPLGDRATNAFERGESTALTGEFESDAALARHLTDDLRDLDAQTRGMLRYYRDHGPGTPMDALFAAGGSDDRTAAYARNRRLRVRGLVEHVGRGRYDYRLAELLEDRTDTGSVRPFVEQIEMALEPDESGSDDGEPAIDGAEELDGDESGSGDDGFTDGMTDDTSDAELL
jgi:TolA-binding protein